LAGVFARLYDRQVAECIEVAAVHPPLDSPSGDHTLEQRREPNEASLRLERNLFLRAGRFGDAAAMKAVAFGAPAYPHVASRLRSLAEPFPRIDLAELRSCPADSFGAKYVAFMDGCKLQPLLVSKEVAEELAPDHILEVRYPILHDAFHVLLDFDTTLPGELGVWTFVASQRYSRTFENAGRWAATLYPIAMPFKRAALRAAAERGRALAAQAPCLISEAITDYWHDPIEAVRNRFSLGPPAAGPRARGTP
jgi:ubiquinone biosynthesis protein COQ4